MYSNNKSNVFIFLFISVCFKLHSPTWLSLMPLSMELSAITGISAGDGAGQLLPPKFRKNIFWANISCNLGIFLIFIHIFLAKYNVKFRHFVNFSYICFRAKMFCLPKLSELLHLWLLGTEDNILSYSVQLHYSEPCHSDTMMFNSGSDSFKQFLKTIMFSPY